MSEIHDIDRIIGNIKSNYQARISGKYNSIPFALPKLNKVIPGIIPGLHYLVTADTKIGKSKFCRQMFVLKPMQWALEHNYKVKFLYFPLEDSRDRVIKMLICAELRNQHQIEMTVEMLDSMGTTLELNDVMIQYIEEVSAKVKEVMSNVTIIDTIRAPSLMFNYILNLLNQPEIGKIIYEGPEEARVPVRYENTSGTHFVIVVDNLNNLTLDAKHENIRASIDDWTEHYVRTWLCNFFRCSVINVQQQSPSSTTQQYTNTGQLILEKLMPSIPGLGDNKATAQTAHVVLGLFSPYRHKMSDGSVFGCSIAKMKDFFRMLRVIASNVGEAPVDIGLFFDGLTEDFSEMPKAQDLEALYNYVRALEQKRGLVGDTEGAVLAPFSNFLD